MKTLKILLFLPLSIFCLKMSAQIDDLLRNKDITWVAEVYNDFQTSSIGFEKSGRNMNDVTLLKFLNKKEVSLGETAFLQTLIVNAVVEERIPCYKDDDCKIKNIKWRPNFIDTILQIDPTTYEEKVKVVNSCFYVMDILFFRAHQIIYYDVKKAQFGIQTLAVAPMVVDYHYKDDFRGWKPLFWIKVTDLSKKRELTDNDITWAAQMNLNTGFDTSPDSIKILKNIGENEPFSSLFQTFSNNPKISFYKEGVVSKEKWTMPEREGYLMAKDTMMDIDAYDNEHVYKIKIVENETKAKDIHRLGLIQNWYWNDKKQRLEICLIATAPMKDIKNEIGEFLYRNPLFYRRTDD